MRPEAENIRREQSSDGGRRATSSREPANPNIGEEKGESYPT